jgi:hypothetical protein
LIGDNEVGKRQALFVTGLFCRADQKPPKELRIMKNSN